MGEPTYSDRVVAGRYRLIEHLGSGGMGTVWLAQDELLRRRVAVKEVFPPPGLSENERQMLRERTLREARTAAQLSHPNVVTIYDVAEDDGRPWIVMELIEARSLRELVDQNGPLDPPAAARVGLQLLAALRSAHAIGVMHRDVKPGNVLMHVDGRAVLADFGIARAENSPATTTSGVLVGSPSYIAPERARGERGGPASDLWSVGATLYAAVEGRPPYEREGALPTLMAVVSEDPDPPRRAGIMWPVISGLLEADPSRRLSSAAAEQMLRQVAESGTAPGTHDGGPVRRPRHGWSQRRISGQPQARRAHPGLSLRPQPGARTPIRFAPAARATTAASASCASRACPAPAAAGGSRLFPRRDRPGHGGDAAHRFSRALRAVPSRAGAPRRPLPASRRRVGAACGPRPASRRRDAGGQCRPARSRCQTAGRVAAAAGPPGHHSAAGPGRGPGRRKSQRKSQP